MKKVLSITFALVICLGLCACGKNTDIPKVSENTTESITTAEVTVETMTETTVETTETIEAMPMGEKVSGTNFEITVKSIEFANLLGKDNTTRLFERDVVYDNPGEGKVFAIIKFDYTNLAKQTVDMVRDIKFTISYKDGYEFVSFEEEKAYIFEDDLNGVYRRCRFDSGYLMELSPLTSASFFIAIPVAEIVSTDIVSTLNIKVDFGPNIKGNASIIETIYINVQ